MALSRLHQANREENNQRKGAFVVLMTDGANNRGLLSRNKPPKSPNRAACRFTPSASGAMAWCRMPVFDDNGRKLGYSRMTSDLDEGALIRIADQTGGKFFRAMDTDTIEKTFAAIDAAQKIEFQAKSYLLTTELFVWFAAPEGILLFLGALFALPPERPRWNAASGRAFAARPRTPRSTSIPTTP